jgi:hypothetical protein
VFVPPPIERTPDGDYRLQLSESERDLLASLPAELAARIDADTADPDLRRLFPPAYDKDEESEDEYRRLMREELLSGRREALQVLAETAQSERLTGEQLDAWLRALTDLRLALGTRLDVTEETYDQEIDPKHPQAFELAVFAYLSWLQEQAVAAAMSS